MTLAGNVDALAARLADEFVAVRGELVDASLGGVLDCSGMTLASQVNAATVGLPTGTRVLLGPHGSGAELGVDETLILRPGLHYEGNGGRERLTRLKATAGFPAGQPLVAAAGYLANAALCDNPVVVRGIDIDCDGKVGSDGLVVFHFWSLFEDVQVHNCTGNGTLSATAAIRLANRGINGTTVTGNSHSENVLHDIRINACASGASYIVQESYSSAGNGGSANQDGHLVGVWFAGSGALGGGRGLDFARAAGWTFRDIHMYGIGDDGAKLLACFATDLDGWYIENYGQNDTAADNYHGLQMELLRGRGSTISNVKISSGQVDSPAANQLMNYAIKAGASQAAMISIVGCGSYLNRTAAPTVRKTQAWRLGESGDTGTLTVNMAGCVTDPLDGWLSPARYVRSASVTLTETPGGVRTQAYSATPSVDPQLVGDRVKMTATGDITSYGVSTTNARDGQVLHLIVFASGATRAVTFASAIRTSTNITRGPYSIASGQLLRAAVEYSSDAAAWVLTAATVSAT
jgi:hypothetical protein